jgi:hypothetical protein
MEFSMQHFASQVCKDGMPHTINELTKKPAG